MNNFNKTVYQVITDGKNKGIMHLSVSKDRLKSNFINIYDSEIVNFGSCSYLGLEFDQRLKDGAIKAIENYGTQFSASRAYISSSHYAELEEKFNTIFDAYCVVAPTTTLGHIAAIPVVVDDNEAIILDHQVHNSVHTATALMKPRGNHVELIRHNRMDLLEKRIVELSKKYDKVWYMADGIYSMYGDGAPIDKIYELLDKYEKFHFYSDDAHGMSCYGTHGRGYVLQHRNIHQKMVLAVSLAKAFATGGAVLVFPNRKLANLVRTCGGPMLTSGPMQPGNLGAALACADIHLSDEIYKLQEDLHENIKYANLLIDKFGLPLVKDLNSPVFFIGVGLPKVAYDIIKRVLDDGFYTNLGIFPGVPIKNTGVRFTITRLNTFKQIEDMITSVNKHFDPVLQEQNFSRKEIYRAFKMKDPNELKQEEKIKSLVGTSALSTSHYKFIDEVPEEEWNSCFKGVGSFDTDGLRFLETVFSGNTLPEDNWVFDYFIVKDLQGKIVLATFFSTGLNKDDLLSHPSVSQKIEYIRQTEDHYFLTSKVVMMGSLLTEGEHLYIDHKHALYHSALQVIFEEAGNLLNKYEAKSIMLRDFEDNDELRDELFLKNGFFKTAMPLRHVVSDMGWKNEDEFLARLSKKFRYHVRSEVLKFAHLFDSKITSNPTNGQIRHWIYLYKLVKSGSLKLNTFDLPEKIFALIGKSKNWEVLSIYLNERPEKEVAVVFNYISDKTYSAMFIGIDSKYKTEFSIYRQSLYRILQRANEIGCTKVNLGFTASLEKRRFGAKATETTVYVQAEDHFNASVIESIEINANYSMIKI